MSLTVPTSEVAICNLALSRLKQAPIMQMDPATDKVSALCAQWYHQKRQEVLRAHTWNFATTIIQLSPASDAEPIFGFSHAYLLPTDWLRYLGRYDDYGSRVPGSDGDYDIQGRYYVMNGEDNESINLKYIKDFQTVQHMDPLFRALFVLELAIVLAPNFSASESRVTTLLTEYKDVKAQATAIDGQERPPRRVQRSKWLEARRRGGSHGASPYTRFDGS